MVASVLILIITVLLLAYWVRYTWVLLHPRTDMAVVLAALDQEYALLLRALHYSRVVSWYVRWLQVDYALTRTVQRALLPCSPLLAGWCTTELTRVCQVLEGLLGWRLRVCFLPAAPAGARVVRNAIYWRGSG